MAMDFEAWMAAQHQPPASDQGPDFADVSTRADALEAAGIVSYAVAGIDGGYDGAVALLADTVRVARSYVERAALVRQEAADDAQAKASAESALARWQAAHDRAVRTKGDGRDVGPRPAPAPKAKRQPEETLQALAGLHLEAVALLDEADAQGQAEAVQNAARAARPLWVAQAEERAATAAAAVDVTAPLPDLRASCMAWQAAQGELQRVSGERHDGDTLALLEAFPGLLTVAASPAIAWLRELHTVAVSRDADLEHEARRQRAKETSIAYAHWLRGLGRDARGIPADGVSWASGELFQGDYDFARRTMNASEIATAGGWDAVEAECDRSTAVQRQQMAADMPRFLRVAPETTHTTENHSLPPTAQEG